MKKFIALLLSALMIMSLAACGSKGSSDNKAEGNKSDLKVALVIGVGGLGDGSFNDILKEGVDTAKEKYGFGDYQLIEPKEVAEFEGHFTQLAASKEYDLIVCGGFDAIEAVSKVAKEFPDQQFLFVDGEVADCDNVKSVWYRDEEKTYCLGIIAAMETKADTLGIVLALDIPSLRRFSTGFIAGAHSVNPDLNINIKIVGGFADTTTAKELALTLADEGCDLVYVAAGGSGLGAFAAAKESGKFQCIGCDINQCLLEPSVVKVSGMRLMQNSIVLGIGEKIDGTFKGGVSGEGFAEGSLDFTNEGSELSTSKEALDAARKAIDGIKDGSIKVPYTYEEIGFDF